MLHAVDIKNFRCFRALRLRTTASINLIAGLNNSGKTALLEAIHLSATAAPWEVLRAGGIRPWSGGPGDAAWRSLFHQSDESSSITLTAHWATGEVLETRVVSTTEVQVGRMSSPPIGLIMEVERRALHSVEGAPGDGAQVYRTEEGTFSTSRSAMPLVGDVGVASATDRPRASVLADRFSALQRTRSEGFVVDALRVMEPRLRDLHVVSERGAPMLWGDLGATSLLPVEAMGDGMTRVLQLVLGVTATPTGRVFLVDEIENGLHHGALEAFWRVLITAAASRGAQVFATTHSLECIRAATRAAAALSEGGVEGRKGDELLRMFRVDRRGDDVAVADYSHEALVSAEALDFEVRG